MRIQLQFALYLVGALAASHSTTLHADALIMPRELGDSARANGCEVISNFYERAGMVEPPYVYGVFAGDKEESAAFWCKKSTAGHKPYLLVLKATPQLLKGCLSTIEWGDFPGGLSVETRKLQLGSFHYVTEPNRVGPSVQIPAAKVIVSYYDGLSEVFYCYKGAWLFASTE